MNESKVFLNPQPLSSIVVSHAGVQYSHPAARAIQDSGFLKAFWNTQLHQPEIRKGLFHSYPWPEIFRKALLILSKGSAMRNQALFWRNSWFDHHVADRLGEFNFDALIGFVGSSLFSFKKAKQLKKWAILDQHDIHPLLAERLLKEEIELNPDFSCLINYWPPHRPYLDRIEKELQMADRILVPSSFSLHSHLAAGLSPKKLILIPCGVYLPKQVSRNEPLNGKFRILFVGTISQRKGIKYLLEALKQLNLPQTELILIGRIDGDPSPLRSYRDFFHHVGFLSQERLEEYWNSSHLFILPSVYDAFGLVISEAMAHALPVIVTENSAAHDVVREGVDGFVVPIRDVEILKNRILKFYKNRDQGREMGQNARQRVKNFTWTQYSLRIQSFLESLISKQGSSFARS